MRHAFSNLDFPAVSKTSGSSERLVKWLGKLLLIFAFASAFSVGARAGDVAPQLLNNRMMTPAEYCYGNTGPNTIFNAPGTILFTQPLADGALQVYCESTYPGICAWAQTCSFYGPTFSGWDNFLWQCPPGYSPLHNMCHAPGMDPDSNKGKGPCCRPGGAPEGNPINALAGNKVQIERDYTGNGAFPLVLERSYNSFGVASGKYSYTLTYAGQWTIFAPEVGPTGETLDLSAFTGRFSNSLIDAGWRHSYDRTLTTFKWWKGSFATLFRGDSHSLAFTIKNGVWVTVIGEQSNFLTEQVDANLKTVGWTYTNENDEIERYDASGKLLSITNPAGLAQVLQYDSAGRLDTVTDPAGRTLKFTYDNFDRLITVLDPAGGIFTYAHDRVGKLLSVSYPDTQSRGYRYNTDGTFFWALTDIIDENGTSFASWSYDGRGNAISSEHAGGVEKVALTYPTPTSTVATDAGGATRTYTTQIVNGIALAGTVNETCGLNCNRTRSMTYDANGNVATRTDYNGVITTYVYDLGRDLQTSRTEAFGTSVARIISTAWHATRRLPVKITEPKRITTYDYDGVGNLQTKTVQASNDVSGAQGLAAVGVGIIRKWTYAYNGSGQILSITGPRTDVVDRTLFTYDAVTGDLSTITNAANHVTTLSNYDAHGHVGRIVAPNGVTIDLSYTPRGWLSSRTEAANGLSETTSYDYDNAGQLKKVTMPDSSVITYTYDDAHRLTTISDSIGNSINYTLDKMSNRTQEQVKDPAGVLTRNTSRIFDALNRVKQQTEGGQ